MFARRVFAAAAVLLAAASAVRCETYLLAEPAQAGDCFHVTIDMKLTGEIRVRKGDDAVKLKLAANASHDFHERILTAGADGLAQKTARVYDTAKATIRVNDDASERTLRPERRLVVAQRDKQQLLVYSTGGGFTQEELEVAHDHFDTLVAAGPAAGQGGRGRRHVEDPERRRPGGLPLRGPHRADADRQAGRGQGRRRGLLDQRHRPTASTRARW